MKKFNKKLLNIKKNKEGKVISFDIDRKYWGYGDEGGTLLNVKTKQMCCLGFYSLACGATLYSIEDKGFPVAVRSVGSFYEQIKWLVGINVRNSVDSCSLGRVNDATSGTYKTPKSKEKRIKQIFEKQGIEVNFVN